ncbi:ABC transporter ATP-binding protein [Enterococcus sp. AZ103]|uniref:ABC transporter ATP-binding protein n=1 Tax=Enterococcus sp. AZ103 TaxID=2774628 RepID=UPI003F235AEF
MDDTRKVLKKFKRPIGVFLGLGIVVSFLSALNVHYFQKIIDSVNDGFDWKYVVFYAISMIFITLFSYAGEWPKSRLFTGLYYYFKEEALTKISVIDYNSYLKQGRGHLLQKIESGATSGRNIYFNFWFRLIRELLPDLLFYLFFIALINYRLVPLILVGYVLVFLVTRILLSSLYLVKKDLLINEESLNRTLTRGISEMVTFRINKRFEKEIAQYNTQSDHVTQGITKMTMTHELFFTVFALLVALIKIATVILFFSGKLMFSIGSLVALITYIDKIYSPIAIFNVLFVQYKLDKISFSRLESFLKEKNDPNLLSVDKEKFGNIQSINVADVTVKIDQETVLKNLNFTFERKFYGIVGASGAGKSTFVKTLLGLLKNCEGIIYYNQQDLSQINLNELYNEIFYLSQDVPVFEGTLRENIVFDQQVSDKEIIDVLIKCQLGDFFKGLTLGLETKIGEQGARLSGGEKQRVAFARLFFSDASLVILDEATSAMDVLTEEALMNQIQTFLNDKIVLTITHRMKNLIYSDQIICFDSGELIETGSYKELYQKQGKFFQLVKEENKRQTN